MKDELWVTIFTNSSTLPTFFNTRKVPLSAKFSFVSKAKYNMYYKSLHLKVMKMKHRRAGKIALRRTGEHRFYS